MIKNIPITKETICCISIASSPGNFGSYIFNQTFKTLSMDYIYKPFRLVPEDLAVTIKTIRALGIRGCGVSMPHKTVIHNYLDKVDHVAKEIGAINTVVNSNGVLTGYNTDVIGVGKALQKHFKIKGKTAHVIGTGGAARAVIVALKKGGCMEIVVSSRDDKKAQKISKEFKVMFCANAKRKNIQADIIINATPVGMSPNTEEMIIDTEELKNYKAVMDVVVSPIHTKLIRIAKTKKKIVIPGYEMALHQAAAQFTLYTKKQAPLALMMKYVKSILKQK